MHKRGIAHLDIKPENILNDHFSKDEFEKSFCYGDLGHSVFSEKLKDLKVTDTLGTRQFWPPELRNNKECYAIDADLYALGGVIFTCVYGAYPYGTD